MMDILHSGVDERALKLLHDRLETPSSSWEPSGAGSDAIPRVAQASLNCQLWRRKTPLNLVSHCLGCHQICVGAVLDEYKARPVSGVRAKSMRIDEEIAQFLELKGVHFDLLVVMGELYTFREVLSLRKFDQRQITRSPSRCIGCRQPQGAPHLAGCPYARFTIH